MAARYPIDTTVRAAADIATTVAFQTAGISCFGANKVVFTITCDAADADVLGALAVIEVSDDMSPTSQAENSGAAGTGGWQASTGLGFGLASLVSGTTGALNTGGQKAILVAVVTGSSQSTGIPWKSARLTGVGHGANTITNLKVTAAVFDNN